MTEKLQGKAALVTGASRGIGLAMVKKLAEEGTYLAMACRMVTDELAKVYTEMCERGQRACILTGDLTEEEAPGELVKQAAEKLGKLDILINNAGIAVPAPVKDTGAALWNLHMNLNARAPFLMCQHAIPYLKKSDHATIINISSVVGIKGYVNQCAYTASKHALMGMSKVLAQEVAHDGIRVHTLCPGGVETDMVTKMRPDIETSNLIRPEEIAEIAMFLLLHRGNAVMDDLHIRRASNEPWF